MIRPMRRPDPFGFDEVFAAVPLLQLAGRETDAEALAARFQGWREFEADLARGLGTSPTVHG